MQSVWTVKERDRQIEEGGFKRYRRDKQKGRYISEFCITSISVPQGNFYENTVNTAKKGIFQEEKATIDTRQYSTPVAPGRA